MPPANGDGDAPAPGDAHGDALCCLLFDDVAFSDVAF